MTVENISWSISTKEWYRPQQGSHTQPPHRSPVRCAANWATKAGFHHQVICIHSLYEWAMKHFNVCSWPMEPRAGVKMSNLGSYLTVTLSPTQLVMQHHKGFCPQPTEPEAGFLRSNLNTIFCPLLLSPTRLHWFRPNLQSALLMC